MAGLTVWGGQPSKPFEPITNASREVSAMVTDDLSAMRELDLCASVKSKEGKYGDRKNASTNRR